MFNKIMVCLDGSELAEKILTFAIEEAVHFNSEIVLFRAYSEAAIISLALPGIPGVQVDAGTVERRIQEDQKTTEEYLDMKAASIQEKYQLKVTRAAVRGAAGPAIVEYCENNGVELIALATHGRSGPGRVVLGSVADYVIRHTTRPVLLIRSTRDTK